MKSGRLSGLSALLNTESATETSARVARAGAGLEQERAESHYLQFDRKDVRLRADQLRILSELARDLQRHSRGRRRITDNTLIRIAVDLLIERANDLSGDSELEILANLRTSQLLDSATAKRVGDQS